jgi:alcohol dehydrogenase YqhD (iron-dependent ADH family)
MLKRVYFNDIIKVEKSFIKGIIMENFIYSTPTKVYFGKDTHKKVGEIINQLGIKKIMLQYGKGSIKKSGLYDDVMASLNEFNITVIEMGGVEPNPKLDFIRKAVEVAKKEKVELILAVGGGSSLDSSKFTAIGAYNDKDVWEYVLAKDKPQGALPVGCILTHSAAGSEMSNSAVLTNMELNLKKGLGSELNRCKFAICNPELTYSVDKYQTACGVVDIMAHTMERYFTDYEDVEITDGIAESLLRTVIKSGIIAIENPTDYDARANIMWASSLSHNGLTACGRENYLVVHQIEHAVSGEYDKVAHGAGLAVLFPAWAKYIYKRNVKRFARFARNVWGVVENDDEKASLLGINAMSDYFASLGMPLSLKDFDIPKDSISRLADLCTYGQTRTIKSYIPLGYQEIKEILELSF